MLNNIKTPYNGIIYDSKTEARYAAHLDQLKSQGKIKAWDRQVPFEVIDDAGHKYKLIVDFLVTFTDRQEIHETKSGYFSDDFKFKLRLYTNRYTYPYFIVEPGKHGGWTYTTPQQFFRIYQPTKELTVITLKKTPTKQHSWIEILLSAALHHFVALFVK